MLGAGERLGVSSGGYCLKKLMISPCFSRGGVKSRSYSCSTTAGVAASFSSSVGVASDSILCS